MSDNAPPLVADEATLRAALAVIRPDGGTLLLVSIDPQPGRPTAGRTFTLPAQTEDAVGWAVNENGRSRNLHFTVNRARDGLSKKSAKTDMRDAYMCWADLDPDIVTHGSYERARAYLTDRFLPTLLETATIVIDSGNGLQAFWRLPSQSRSIALTEWQASKQQIGPWKKHSTPTAYITLTALCDYQGR